MKRRFPPSLLKLRPQSFPIRLLTYPTNQYNQPNAGLGISLPSVIPFQIPINHCKTSLTYFNTPVPSSVLVETKYPDCLKSFQSYDETYGNLIHRYTGSCDVFDAKNLHIRLIKGGLINDTFLCNTLINIFCRVGDFISARLLFDEMCERNTVSWTCLISGHVQWGLHEEAFILFRTMIKEEFLPTHFTFGSMLRACQDSGAQCLAFGMQIHALISKTHYVLDIIVCNALLSMYGSCCISSTDDARQVFDGMLVKNSISWNSIISVYSQKGDVLSAFQLFSEMQRQHRELGLKPNEYTYGSLITATNSSSCYSNLFLLEQMLSRVIRSGFSKDLYVGSALVSAFGRLGSLDIARQIFENMCDRNAVSMNGLMVGLVKQKHGEEAVEIFRGTRGLVGRNFDSYVVLLSACAEFEISSEGRKKGREVHGFAIRNGLIGKKVAIENGLVNMYAKCGYIDDACRVFELMGVKDLVSWNSMISGLDQNGHLEEALKNFQRMRKNGLMPSNFTFISTLSSCASIGFIRMGAQLQGEAIKIGYDSDIPVLNSLLALYADSGLIFECRKIFNCMPDYDQVSWNSMIGAFANSEGSTSEAIEVFRAMMQGGWSLSKVTFINIFAALSSLSFLELSQQVHALVLKYSLTEDNAVENALLSCYAKCGDMDTCENLFSKMSNSRDEVSWNSMVSGYIQNGLLERAMDFLCCMIQNGQNMDCFTFATILSACASIAALEHGMEMHAYGIRSVLESDVVVESALIDMYSKCGRIDYASSVFRFMPLRNEYSWNSMISGFARHGHGRKALEVFEEMQEKGPRPNCVTFVGVLSACSHVGLVDQGLKHFESMKKYGLTPKIEHYSCLVDLLGRAGELDKIEKLITGMPIEPNALIWRTILAACGRTNSAKTDLGKKAAEMLLELEPQNPVNYVLISNMYASGGKWEDVAKARATMRGVQVKKEAGCSWVTMRDGVHIFVAGDKSHPETDQIYDELRILNEKLKSAGYVPQTKFVLYDLDVENKEELLSYHSERLAVAFALTRTSGIPIRIMKNLRICGDCHSAFGYICKIAARLIIVRDSNRFHHFENGKCSCGDYW